MLFYFWLAVVVCVTAFTSTAYPVGASDAVRQPSQSATAVLDPTPTPDTSGALPATPEVQAITLVVWLPDTVVPPDDMQISSILFDQIEAFDDANPMVNVEIRRKRSQDVGGILSTMRAAASVAPGALPDVTLLRREDLLIATQNRLVQPLDDIFAAQIFADMYPAVMQLGVIGGQMFGVPYMIEALLLATTEDVVLPRPTFEAMLDQRVSFAFPAGQVGAVNNTLLLQYLAAGGSLPQEGETALVPSALESVLEFYELMRDESLIDARILEYTSSADYQQAIMDGTLDAGVMSSSVYLRLKADDPSVQMQAVPTQRGEPSTVVNGWVWVIATPNVERQAASAQLIEWLMSTERQRELTSAIRTLPSQRAVLRASWRTELDVQLIDQMLLNAVLPTSLDVSAFSSIPMSFGAVLRDEQSAQEAMRQVLEQQQNP